MIEKKIENEKFILTFCYDEKLKKFQKAGIF